MSPQISFCINTCRNERNHIELLFRSLYKNLSRRDYPIIVYVENDNQDTFGWLKTQKENFPNLKIIKNPLPVPLDYGRNINLMFETAETDIVSYLQSDMVICKDYDLEVVKYLAPDTIVSSTRIEPPLHPPSPEKITHDFGLDPTKFDLEKFTVFAQANKKDRVTNFWFAPFTLYKKVWNDIGGHDTLFRRSRVDSDILYRLSLNGVKTIQAWNAIVYHFTCTSSRGPEWWTQKAQQRTQLQAVADQIELARFLHKWSTFKHPSTPEEVKGDYFYQISANLHHCPLRDLSILQYYWMFHRIHVDNKQTYSTLKEAYERLHDPANQLHVISNDNWEIYKKYYRLLEFEQIFTEHPITDDDSILDIDLNGETFAVLATNPVLAKRQELVHTYKSEAPGEFELEGTNIKLTLNNPVDRIKENLTVVNPPIDGVNLIIV